MILETVIDLFGDAGLLLAGGLAVGAVFGAFAQLSKFCLRSAVIEFSHGVLGPKVAVWVLTFSAAVAATQAFIALGLLDVTGARQLAASGSLSGSLIGGLMFGAGMILARGCASRLLVLSATGNLRALISGLILTIAAQASLRGVLSPIRERLSDFVDRSRGPIAEPVVDIPCGSGFGPGLGSFMACLRSMARAARTNRKIGWDDCRRGGYRSGRRLAVYI